MGSVAHGCKWCYFGSGFSGGVRERSQRLFVGLLLCKYHRFGLWHCYHSTVRTFIVPSCLLVEEKRTTLVIAPLNRLHLKCLNGLAGTEVSYPRELESWRKPRTNKNTGICIAYNAVKK